MSPLYRIRTELFRVSQSEMARIAGVAQPTISRWESGAHSPTLAEVGRIRAAAKERRLRWSDSRLFDQPQAAQVVSPSVEARSA